jgi:hypothetical protein
MKYIKNLLFFLLLFVMSCCSSKSEKSEKMMIRKDSVTLVKNEDISKEVIHDGSRESSTTETADIIIKRSDVPI